MPRPESHELDQKLNVAFAEACSSPAPQWYSPDEMHHYLKRNGYSDEIAAELSTAYAKNLQGAFVKGYEIGKREAKRENDKLSGANQDHE